MSVPLLGGVYSYFTSLYSWSVLVFPSLASQYRCGDVTRMAYIVWPMSYVCVFN